MSAVADLIPCSFNRLYPGIAEPCSKVALDDADQLRVVCQEPSVHGRDGSPRPAGVLELGRNYAGEISSFDRHRIWPILEDIRVCSIPCCTSPWQDDDARTRGFLYVGRLDEVNLDQRRLQRSMTISVRHLQVE